MCMIAHVQSNTVDCDVSIMTLTGARRDSCGIHVLHDVDPGAEVVPVRPVLTT